MTKQNFSDLLEAYFHKTRQSSTQIARVSGIPRTTLDTWLSVGVKRPRDAQQVLMLAYALQVTEHEADDLLRASRHPTISHFRELAEQTQDAELLEILSFWSLFFVIYCLST